MGAPHDDGRPHAAPCGEDVLAEGEAIVALGSNIGDKAAHLTRALRLLTRSGEISVRAVSRYYQTPPWGKTDQDWFLNACARVETTLGPHALLERCLATETEMGRVRAEKWGPRIIDLDVLAHGQTSMATADLTLPHPHITVRAFVLAPLADVAPDLCLEGRAVRDWLAEIDRTGVVPIGA
ncbi:MAG: 2-amino-4-hydroxy-6-hydroxymethyldihydropteridine diphosphokinase [Hyphomicrobiaceae bacterium]|nr:2-amino-4-hydroxy-6-hydroxymethyldihydropteridine diphosphokinase [Hyphomicrobiaceae bacterium]